MNPGLKYGIIGGTWLIFLLFGLLGNTGTAETNVSGIINTQAPETTITTSENNVALNETSIPETIITITESPTESTTEATTTTTTETKTVAATKPTVTMVWISSKGKKYHTNSTCSNMKKPKKVKLSYAKKHKYKPCKRCGA